MSKLGMALLLPSRGALLIARATVTDQREHGMERVWIALAGLAGTAAVAADAAARHLLAGDPDRFSLAATGARYGLVHAAALVAVVCLRRAAAAGGPRLWLAVSGWCLVAGLLLFCAPLYLLAAGLAPAARALVPAGGTLFIAGWAALLISALAPRRRS